MLLGLSNKQAVILVDNATKREYFDPFKADQSITIMVCIFGQNNSCVQA